MINELEFQKVAPDLVKHYQAARVSLTKHQLSGQRAAVYLVIDHSGSMRPFFQDHSVQQLADRVLALAAQFDDDGVVPVIFFDTKAHPAHEIRLGQHAGAIDRIKASIPKMGMTNYAAAINAVVAHYQQSGSSDPALVVFQTDGAPSSRSASTQAICAASQLPIFWQFIGFGNDEFAYLHRLDDLEVPRYRLVDNAGFFAAGPTPMQLPDGVLFDALMGEFPQWLTAARQAGVLRD
jgi:hypothetical protein